LLQELLTGISEQRGVVILNTERHETFYFNCLDIGQQNKAGEDSKIAHRHKEKASQNGVYLYTAIHVFAGVVEGLEVEDAAIELGTHFFCLLQRSGELL
jgi:hypothetical protein